MPFDAAWASVEGVSHGRLGEAGAFQEFSDGLLLLEITDRFTGCFGANSQGLGAAGDDRGVGLRLSAGQVYLLEYRAFNSAGEGGGGGNRK
jgi:hypothetical protein